MKGNGNRNANHKSVIWDGRSRGHMEWWVTTLNQMGTGAGFRIRYALLVPQTGPVRLEVAVSAQDPVSTTSNISAMTEYEADKLSWTDDPFWLEVGPCSLELDRMTGMMDAGGTPVTWDLLYKEVTDPLQILPARFYRPGSGGIRLFTPLPFMLIGGKIQIGDRQFLFNGDPGQQTHFWAQALPEAWRWFHCSAFIGEGGDPLPAYIAGYSLRDWLIAGIPLPSRSFGHLVWNEQHVQITPVKSWSKGAAGHWTWSGIYGSEKVVVAIDVPRGEEAGFAGPAGDRYLVCHSERADCTVRFEGMKGTARTFHASGLAHVETGTRRTGSLTPGVGAH